jgi:ABC-type transporter Mla MlaB component
VNKLQFFIHHDSDALRIELAGSLSCPDVESVLQAWQKEFSTAAGRTLVADISYVADADKHGRALLAMWHRSGARIVARSPQSWALAKPIVNQPVDADAPKRGWLRRLIDLLAGARPGPVRITVPAEMPCPSSVDLARKTSAVLMH